MMLLRSRQRELDSLRITSYGFCHSWILFFGTCPPGIHPAGVFFTRDEQNALTNSVPLSAEESGPLDVEPYDPNIHNRRGVVQMHARRTSSDIPE